MIIDSHVNLHAPQFDEDRDAVIERARAAGVRLMVEISDRLTTFEATHGLAMATGFDDNGTQTPARLLRSIRQLGYRGSIVHYLGMSHYFRLTAQDGRYLAGGDGDPLCRPARARRTQMSISSSRRIGAL